jgi:hypothetical protein
VSKEKALSAENNILSEARDAEDVVPYRFGGFLNLMPVEEGFPLPILYTGQKRLSICSAVNFIDLIHQKEG